MKLHEVIQVMADNAIPDKDGDVCVNGHVMHNLLMNGKRIETVGEHELFCALHHPERFSLAPRTHMVNGFEVPAPEVEALTKGQKYFFGYGKLEEWFGWYFWRDDCMDRRMLNGKNVFLTPEAAIANAKAMLGIDPYSEEE